MNIQYLTDFKSKCNFFLTVFVTSLKSGNGEIHILTFDRNRALYTYFK